MALLFCLSCSILLWFPMRLPVILPASLSSPQTKSQQKYPQKVAINYCCFSFNPFSPSLPLWLCLTLRRANDYFTVLWLRQCSLGIPHKTDMNRVHSQSFRCGTPNWLRDCSESFMKHKQTMVSHPVSQPLRLTQ